MKGCQRFDVTPFINLAIRQSKGFQRLPMEYWDSLEFRPQLDPLDFVLIIIQTLHIHVRHTYLYHLLNTVVCTLTFFFSVSLFFFILLDIKFFIPYLSFQSKFMLLCIKIYIFVYICHCWIFICILILRENFNYITRQTI